MFPRPFLAPELLFGPKQYEACKTDLWSLGCALSHFFTPIRLFKQTHSHSFYDSDGDGEDDVAEFENEERQRTSMYMLSVQIFLILLLYTLLCGHGCLCSMGLEVVSALLQVYSELEGRQIMRIGRYVGLAVLPGIEI